MRYFEKIARVKKDDLTTPLIAGAGAGLISTALTNPIKQVSNFQSSFPRKYSGKSMLAVAKDIHKRFGYKGFYKGFGSGTLSTIPQAALWMLVATGITKALMDKKRRK